MQLKSTHGNKAPPFPLSNKSLQRIYLHHIVRIEHGYPSYFVLGYIQISFSFRIYKSLRQNAALCNVHHRSMLAPSVFT